MVRHKGVQTWYAKLNESRAWLSHSSRFRLSAGQLCVPIEQGVMVASDDQLVPEGK